MQEELKRFCYLPLEFQKGDKSIVQDMNLDSESLHLDKASVKDFVEADPELIKIWHLWSCDKRCQEGFYLILDKEKYLVGYINEGRKLYEQSFTDPVAAAADYIVKELMHLIVVKSTDG
jgi:hypothetical protein